MKKTQTLFELPKKFALHFIVLFFIKYIYIYIYIFVLIQSYT